MTPGLKWRRHEDLSIRRGEPGGRDEFLAHMTFQANERALFTGIFGPLIGLKEEWELKGASPEKLDFSTFRVMDVLETISETAFRVLERVMWVAGGDLLDTPEDMEGKSGPLAGSRQVRTFLKPYYRRMCDLLQERGGQLFDRDSDENMAGVIPVFLE